MLTLEPTFDRPPQKFIVLEVTRPCFVNGKPLDVGTQFRCDTTLAGEALSSQRCKIADGEDRSLVYRDGVFMF